MRGTPDRHKPGTSRAATRIAPAIAVGGAMVGMPHHFTPPPPRTTPVEHVVLDSSVKSASAARAYVVQPGDTLWGIAQRFYGNPVMWSHIYYANRSQILVPNEIYPGQRFTIPQGCTISATTST